MTALLVPKKFESDFAAQKVQPASLLCGGALPVGGEIWFGVPEDLERSAAIIVREHRECLAGVLAGQHVMQLAVDGVASYVGNAVERRTINHVAQRIAEEPPLQ